MPRKKKANATPYNAVLTPDNYGTARSRKDWEIQQTLRALTDHGALHADAEILGAGAGVELTTFHISNDVKRVFATDLYLDAGIWNKEAPRDFMMNPSAFSKGMPHHAHRIVAQHADMLHLPYEDASFDGIYSCGSIEHVGSFADVAQAASELGRVLKPGGVLSLCTEWKLAGQGIGWHGVLLFDEQQLHEYIIDPSGCEMMGDFMPGTFATDEPTHSLEEIVRTGLRPDPERYIQFQDYIFTSVHLCLRKPA